jgi:transcriptional regulator with XRE-family HTH domain
VSFVADQFGRNLKRERERVGVSQEELGLSAELHRTEISQLERGLRTPRIDTLVKLAGSLDVDPEDLLKGVEWKPGTRTRGGYV